MIAYVLLRGKPHSTTIVFNDEQCLDLAKALVSSTIVQRLSLCLVIDGRLLVWCWYSTVPDVSCMNLS